MKINTQNYSSPNFLNETNLSKMECSQKHLVALTFDLHPRDKKRLMVQNHMEFCSDCLIEYSKIERQIRQIKPLIPYGKLSFDMRHDLNRETKSIFKDFVNLIMAKTATPKNWVEKIFDNFLR